MAKNKPQIRFQGHENEWEEKTLKQVVNYSSTGVRACDVSDNGLYDLYDANEVIGKTSTFASETPYISIIKDGSGVGRVRLLPGRTNCLGTMGVITPKDSNDVNFAFSHLQTKDFKKHIISGAIPHVYFRDYGEDELCIPQPIEQKKIGELFRSLDELIEAKEQELEKLRQIKLALLDGMFPSDEPDKLNGGYNALINSVLQTNGQLYMSNPELNVPVIRFRGFTEPWELRTFGYYGNISMCKRVMKYQTTEKGEVPFYKIGTFGHIADAYISKELFDNLKRNYPYPQKGDILISAAGTIGRTVEFSGDDEYFQDSNIVWLNHNNTIYNHFLKITYSIVKWNGLEGSTLKRLYNNNILNTKFYIPSFAEQKKIGDFFSEQDENIRSAQLQINKLRNIKQACMQKMFA